ncbi:hypothetical protein ABVF61_02270 [Roseibium sp. HPY-6]|uniref:hypothetical protein n=1 Tax=Roseibium sp. HPY-6 TaxID=3229852 RepID=UPI00338D67EA
MPDKVWAGGRAQPDGGLPDGSFAVYKPGKPDAVAAWYGSPTRRYGHGILGDAIEAGSLHVATRNGDTYTLTLPDSEVFEDRTPRIVDLDNDGRFEVVTIRAYLNAGASVALFGLRGGKLVELASTPAIGTPNRWLNIAGIADYAGRGKPQIAYVETPHIGGTLHFVEWRGNRLAPVASIRGFSNHRIGAREQELTADIDYDGNGRPDIAVPANNRAKLRIIGIREGRAVELHAETFPAAIKTSKRPAPGSNAKCVQMVLETGKSVEVCAGT